MADLDKIVDSLSSLTVIEAADLGCKEALRRDQLQCCSGLSDHFRCLQARVGSVVVVKQHIGTRLGVTG